MSEDVKTVAEPSPSTPVVYDSWDDHGTPIVSKKSEPSKQDSAPASSEAKAESAAESEAAKNSQEPKPKTHKPKLTAEERIAELEATIEKIRKNAGRETKADPSPAPKPAPKAAADSKEPVEPDIDQYDGSEGKTLKDYNKAMAKYARDYAEYLSEKRDQERTIRETVQAGLKKLQSEIEEAAGRYEDFTIKDIDDAAGKIYSDGEMNVLVKQAFMESDVLIDLLYALNGEDGGIDAFVKEAKASPTKAMKRIAVLESLIREEIKSGKRGKSKVEAESAEEEGDKGKKAKEVPAPAPRAPKPPPEVGGRGSATEDPAVAAARAGDFRSAEAEWNRKAFRASH